MYKLHLEEMRFYAYHGLLEEEGDAGGWFTVSISIEVQGVPENDQIEEVVDYEKIFNCCREIMQDRKKLIETLAVLIKKKLTELGYIATVRLCKERPPVKGYMKQACIEI